MRDGSAAATVAPHVEEALNAAGKMALNADGRYDNLVEAATPCILSKHVVEVPASVWVAVTPAIDRAAVRRAEPATAV